MGLIRFLAIAIIGYYVFRLVMRYLIPLLAKVALKKATEHITNQMNQQMGGQQARGEKIYDSGKVEIRKTPQGSNQKTQSAGDDEYVDFEEIKD